MGEAGEGKEETESVPWESLLKMLLPQVIL